MKWLKSILHLKTKENMFKGRNKNPKEGGVTMGQESLLFSGFKIKTVQPPGSWSMKT